MTCLGDRVGFACPATLWACGAGDGNRTHIVSLGINSIWRIHCGRLDHGAGRIPREAAASREYPDAWARRRDGMGLGDMAVQTPFPFHGAC